MKKNCSFGIPTKIKFLVGSTLALLAGTAISSAADAFLTASDAGGISALTSSTAWTIAGAPSAANDYYSSNFFLRTPTGSGSVTFAGNSLTLQPPSGQSAPMRSLLFKGNAGYVIVINNFTNAGGIINSGAGNVAAPTFTGNLMTVVSNSMIQADQGPFIIGYPLAGSADLTNTTGGGAANNTITYTNNNSAFQGRFVLLNNVTVAFTSPNGAPGNPAVSTPSQFDIGAGCTLLDNAGISLTNVNGGITLEGNATINASSNTMVISEPITDNGYYYSLIKRGGGILTLSGSNTFSGGLSFYGITAGGQLNINSPNALGTGNFTINNGNNAVIDNTSGADLTLANDVPQSWANNFAFAGSSSLNMGLGYVTMGGSLTVTVSNNDLTVGTVTDNGYGYSLTKAGAGMLTLNGGGAYYGATTVAGGSLVVLNGSLYGSSFNVASNAILDLSAAGGLYLPSSSTLAGSGTVVGQVTDNYATSILPGGGGTAGTLTINGDLTLNGDGSMTFDLTGNTTPGSGTNDLLVVTGALNLAGPTTTIQIAGFTTVGTYTLIHYGSLTGSLANLSAPVGYALNNNTSAKTIELVVTHVPANLTWVGDGSANIWDLGTTPNWKQGASTGLDFFTGDSVTFDDSGSASPAIYINGAVSPTATTVNSTQTYDFTGSGILSGSLTKSGAGTLILENSNSYAGPTVINGGTLQLGNGGNTGVLGTGSVTNNGAIVVNGSTTANFASVISGTGSLTIQAGSATLSASNNYTGATMVSGGTLYVVNGSSLGATNGGTVVADGGKIYITANVNIGLEPLSLAGTSVAGGALEKGGGGVSGYSGPVTLTTNSAIGIDGGATLNLSNTVSGAAALTALGSASGTLSFNAPGTFSGGFVLNGPVINLNANGALGTGPVTVNGTGRFVLASGLNFTNAVTANTVSPGVATGFLMTPDNTNGLVTTISGPLTFNASPANGNDFVGPTSSGYLNVTAPITNITTGVVGSRNGFVRFSGGGDYTTFGINQGTVSIGSNNGLCSNAVLSVSVSAASIFDLNGFNQTLAGLADGATFAEVVTNSAAAPGTLTLNVASSSTYGGVIGGNVALVQNGPGTQSLTGVNTYTGNTTVNGGILELAQPSLAAVSKVTVANGAMLQLDFAVTNQVAGLVLNGAPQALGVYNSTTSPSFITGSGSLVVAVPGPSGPASITNSVSGNTLSLSWPAGQGWRLQMQTNGLSAGLSTNWVYVTDGTASSTNITTSPNVPTAFYRLVYP